MVNGDHGAMQLSRRRAEEKAVMMRLVMFNMEGGGCRQKECHCGKFLIKDFKGHRVEIM